MSAPIQHDTVTSLRLGYPDDGQGLTLGDVARFVDVARTAGYSDDTTVSGAGLAIYRADPVDPPAGTVPARMSRRV